MSKSGFEVPNRAVSDLTGGQLPATTEQSGDTEDHFEVPQEVVRELGSTAGSASDANELLDDTPEASVAERAPETPEAAEATRAARNFSFTGGETSSVFERLNILQCSKALGLRNKMISFFEDKEWTEGLITERSIGMLCVGPGEYYIVHLGEPLPDLPVIDMEKRSWENTYERDRNSTHSYVRFHGRKVRIVNLADTPAMEPPLLAVTMGNSENHWERALPPLHDRKAWKRAGKQWQPWSPAIKL